MIMPCLGPNHLFREDVLDAQHGNLGVAVLGDGCLCRYEGLWRHAHD